jgi:hypothetical protein
MALYFDIFRHPLSVAELERLLAPGQRAAVEAALQEGERHGRLLRQGELVLLPGAEAHIARRRSRARQAELLWPAARRSAAILARWPFVRGVFITGGLSKNSVEADADVDFLLLVEPGAVWTTKSLLQAFRYPLPHRLREHFCTNYLLATDQLQIDERNAFTAIELATAVPMAGRSACLAFYAANQWAQRFVPGLAWSAERAALLPEDPPGQPAVEVLLRRPGMDRSLRGLWDRYWERKYHYLPESERRRRFKRREELATNHLHDFQGHVLRELSARLTAAGLDPTVVLP